MERIVWYDPAAVLIQSLYAERVIYAKSLRSFALITFKSFESITEYRALTWPLDVSLSIPLSLSVTMVIVVIIAVVYLPYGYYTSWYSVYKASDGCIWYTVFHVKLELL